MSDEPTGSFVRWQGRTISQLGFVNNLLIGLATGLVALLGHLATQSLGVVPGWERCLLLMALILIFASLGFGCWLTLNRLGSFRGTMRIARKREKGDRTGIEELRAKTKKADKRTWCLLWWQTLLFGVGSLVMAIGIGTRLWLQ